jgi:ubiquinone/menaquinone biosynthesis C-methylase UbiE
MSTPIDRERQYWSSHDEFVWLSTPDIILVLDKVRQLSKYRGDIVELCAGSGMFTEHIDKCYDNYYAIDISQSLLDRLKINVPDAIVLLGNAQEPQVHMGCKKVDVVLCFAGLHHLPDLPLTFKNSKSILKNGGRFCAFEPNKDAWYRKVLLPLRKILNIYTEDEVFLSPKVLMKQMEYAGFSNVRVEYVSPQYSINGRSLLIKVMIRIYGFFAFINKGRLGSSFFIINADA